MPKAKSTKPDTPQFLSWDEVDGAGQEVCKLHDLIAAHQAELDKRAAELKEMFKGDIQDLQTEQKLLLQGMEDFVSAHRGDLVGRSRKLTHTVVGFRLNPPSVASRLKSFAKVLERMLGLGRKAERFIAVKREINKSAIMDAYKAGDVTPADLQELGLKIEQKELFFCEPAHATVAEADPAA